ncbi:hypothetical protein [Rhodococcus ruber]|uniref:hypothetical protein n=1 Tax=Rhodococcus ruber TaxID=1830 RepID=UPI003784E6D0
MTPDQLRLLRELTDWQILGLADNPDYWCRYIRDGQGGGTPSDKQWRAAGLWRATYRWGIAMTTHGDYMRERSIRDPEHAVTLTWRQITGWVNRFPDELRADARRARTAADPDEKHRVAEQLLEPTAADPEVLALW